MRFYSVFFSLLLALNPNLSRSEEKPSEAIERTIHVIEEGYPSFVHATFLDLIQSRFLLNFEDYRKSVLWITKKSEASAQQFQKVDVQWKEKMNELDGDHFFEKLTELLFLKESLPKEQRLISTLLQDLNILKDSWNELCSEKKIEGLAQFYNPSNLFMLDHIDFIQIPSKNLSFEIGVSINTSGEFSQTNHSGMSSNEIEDAVPYVGSAVGSCLLGPVGGFVGMVVGSLVKCMILGIENIPIIREINQEWNLIEKLRGVQKNILDHESVGIKPLIEKNCRDFFSGNMENYFQNSIQEVNAYQKSLDQVQNKIDQDWERIGDLFKNKLKTYNEDYLPRVKENYLYLLKKKLENKVILDQEIIRFMQLEVGPALSEWDLKKGESDLNFNQAQQSLWSEIILGDVRFYQGESFSFGALDFAIKPKETSYWDNGVFELLKVMRSVE